MLSRGDIFNDRYKIKSELGVGGMGAVYLAEDLSTERLIALKILKSELNKNETLVKRFQNEGVIGQRLSYDHIVKIYDYTVSKNGEYYLTMEYVEGGSLREKIEDGEIKKAIPFEKLPQLLIEIARPLAYIHEKDIIHRDLKPENILVGKNNKIKLSDFGVALSLQETQRITQTQSGALGTLQYLSPEQWGDLTIDHRADIYAFGVIAFELATGRVPYEYSTYHSIEKALETDSVPEIAGKEGIPYWFQDFIEKCLAKDRKQRFQSMEEVIDVLSENDKSFHLPRGMMRLKRKITKISPGIRNAVIAILFAQFVVLMTQPLPGLRIAGYLARLIDSQVLDAWFFIRGPLDPPKGVLIVALDDESHKKYNVPIGSIWPREIMAELLNRLSMLHPQKIAVDFRFLTLIDPGSDALLAGALQRSGAALAEMQDYSSAVKSGPHGLRPTQWYKSHDYFSSATPRTFFANLTKVREVVRHFSFRLDRPDPYPGIASFIFENPEMQPLPKRGEFINYYGPPGTIDKIPLLNLMEGKLDELDKSVRGRIVLIGKQLFLASNEDKSDLHISQGNYAMWGVEIHANSIANMLDKTWIKRLPFAEETLVIMLFSALLAFSILVADFLYAAVIFAGACTVWPIISYSLYISGCHIPATTSVILLTSVFLPKIMIYFIRLNKRKKLFNS